MNLDNLRKIADTYITKFDFINDDSHRETYKWEIASSFKPLMDQALSSDNQEFAEKLIAVKNTTSNVIDSYTRPFAGLCKLAEIDPQSVKSLLIDLYADDHNDISVRQKKIDCFLRETNNLIDKHLHSSYMFPNDYHAVTGYMFLYDPDNNYLFKTTHARLFADVIGFYGDWGSGKNTDLKVYYEMCDEALSILKTYPDLMKTDQSRFGERFPWYKKPLHADTNKHILLFDIIYCASVYSLFEGLTYTKHSNSGKKEYAMKKKRALYLQEQLNKIIEDEERLQNVIQAFINIMPVGTEVFHKRYGAVSVVGYMRNNIVVNTPEGEKALRLSLVISNGFLTKKDETFKVLREQNKELLEQEVNLENIRMKLEDQIQPLMVYLD